MNDLCSLLSRLEWVGRHFSNIFMLLSPKKTSFINILWGDNAENEDYNYNNQSQTKCNAGNERNSIKISYSHINLFLNLLWTLRRALGGALGGPLTHIEKHWCNLKCCGMLNNIKRKCVCVHIVFLK